MAAGTLYLHEIPGTEIADPRGVERHHPPARVHVSFSHTFIGGRRSIPLLSGHVRPRAPLDRFQRDQDRVPHPAGVADAQFRADLEPRADGSDPDRAPRSR
jgi:hypothetical protein